jgi:signal transduction histidine kinase/CheY-like chemotaxis protein
LRGTWKAYGLALVASAAGVAVTRVTWPFFSIAPFAPVFGAVALVSHLGGEGAGLATSLLGAAGLALAFSGAMPFAWSIPLFVYFAITFVANHLIAGRNRAHAALGASEARLRATLEQVRAAEERMLRAHKIEAVGQLAAGVAHNFNNLLQVTMGYTDMLLDGDVDPAFAQTAISEIRHATERGAVLTRQLMAFGRRQEARVARVDLDATLSGVREMLAGVIREDIELVMRIDSGRAAVMIDPSDLEQILFNLVLNARDALPDGGAIRVEAARTTVDAATHPADYPIESGEYARLSVIDNGVGMTGEVLEHLFEPFFTTKEVGEGTGLGLAFVHGVARHAGGFVTVQSRPGEGTTVAVHLPIEGTMAPVATVTPSPIRRATRAATILLVEDEAAVRGATERLLTRAGYQVKTAANADEACAVFDRKPSEIDLLLTDVVMPGMHGPELAARLAGQRPDLPVVFVSGYSDEMPSLPVVSSRASFVAKPFTVAALVDAVEGLLMARAS